MSLSERASRAISRGLIPTFLTCSGHALPPSSPIPMGAQVAHALPYLTPRVIPFPDRGTGARSPKAPCRSQHRGLRAHLKYRLPTPRHIFLRLSGFFPSLISIPPRLLERASDPSSQPSTWKASSLENLTRPERGTRPTTAIMSVAWNGTEGVYDGGYSAGVSDFNIFYDVRLPVPLPSRSS